MALADILETIRSGADAESATIAAEADAEINQIRNHAQRSADEEGRRLAHSRDAAIIRTTDRIVNQAQLEADRRVRAAAERVYAQIRNRTKDHLAALRGTVNYQRVLGELIDECRAVLPDATTIRVDRSDAESAAAMLAERGWERCEMDDALETIGGVVAVAGDGRSVRNTFETRLERADRHCRQLVAELIPALGGGL